MERGGREVARESGARKAQSRAQARMRFIVLTM
jgi:hypothetical protein